MQNYEAYLQDINNPLKLVYYKKFIFVLHVVCDMEVLRQTDMKTAVIPPIH